LTPQAKRAAVAEMQSETAISERRACQLVGLARRTLCYQPHRSVEDSQLQARFRGCPQSIRTDQGPESTGKALGQWAYQHGVELKLIQAGKPKQNAFVESFNGKLRDECLDEHGFHSIEHARATLRQWRQDWNEHRPHSMPGYQTPAEKAEQLRNQ
jgi:transposase InsO family protein